MKERKRSTIPFKQRRKKKCYRFLNPHTYSCRFLVFRLATIICRFLAGSRRRANAYTRGKRKSACACVLITLAKTTKSTQPNAATTTQQWPLDSRVVPSDRRRRDSLRQLNFFFFACAEKSRRRLIPPNALLRNCAPPIVAAAAPTA